MLVAGVDTALVNTGLVILDEAGAPFFSGKPLPKKEWKGDSDSLFHTHHRIRAMVAWIENRIHTYSNHRLCVAFEDYLMSGRQRSYKTAEMLALLKDWCWSHEIPYCLVHPAKTKKYVVKKKKVTKKEIIDYVMAECPRVFNGIDRADYSDIADAWVIAKIGWLVFRAVSHPDPKVAVRDNPQLEDRWKEILLGPTGIMEKPGLVYLPR